MYLRHAAALALASWYLLIPVPSETFGTPQAQLRRDLPLGRWKILHTFESRPDCEKMRGVMIWAVRDNNNSADPTKRLGSQAAQYSECIASDDPRLKP
jgi:hypothetical protein